MTDYPDWQTPAANAQQIAKTGVGLLRFANELGSGGTVNVPAATFATLLDDVSVTQTSMQFTLTCNLPAGAGTIPFVTAELIWVEPTDTYITWQENYIASCGNGPLNQITTRFIGPCNGDSLSLSVFNNDPAQQLTVTYYVEQTSHLYAVPRWEQAGYAGAAPIGYTNPSGDPLRGIVAWAQPTIAASGSQSRLIAASYGKWRVLLDNSGGSDACTLTFTDPTGWVLAAGSELFSGTAAAGAVLSFEFNAPPSPVQVKLANDSAGGAITPTLIIVREPY